jgi:hypothetical protein
MYNMKVTNSFILISEFKYGKIFYRNTKFCIKYYCPGIASCCLLLEAVCSPVEKTLKARVFINGTRYEMHSEFR